MLKMTNATKELLNYLCPQIPMDKEHLNELLDYLDDAMLDTLNENYVGTEKTLPVAMAYDDLYYSNE